MEVTDNLWRVQVSIKNMVIMVMGRAPIDQDPVPKRMMEVDFDHDWGITIDQQGNPANLKEAIISGVAIAVSDRSFQGSNGLAAWTIEGRNHDH